MTPASPHDGRGLPIILASASPRRSQLLTQASIPFEKFVVEVDEPGLSAVFHGPLLGLGEYLAGEKALAAWRALATRGAGGRRVLASDTTVLLAGRSLAKPADSDEATAMLRDLRGREHTVATGVALVDPERGVLRSATSATRVRMRDYSDSEISAYVATGDPLDKAGAYSIQHPDFQPVASLRGCHLGVIGLPVCLVWALLGGAGARRIVPAPVESGDRSAPDCPWSAGCRAPYPFDSPGVHSRPLSGIADWQSSASEAGG